MTGRNRAVRRGTPATQRHITVGGSTAIVVAALVAESVETCLNGTCPMRAVVTAPACAPPALRPLGAGSMSIAGIRILRFMHRVRSFQGAWWPHDPETQV